MKKLFFVLLIIGSFVAAKAQKADPFLPEIKNFKKQDSLQFPPKNAVLFIGSSTFTKWKDAQKYFPGHVIVNRGFGGSSLPNVIDHVGDVVFPYAPKQVVIYCGENDFGGGASVDEVVSRAKKLIDTIRSQYPKVYIAYISIKPSPSRVKYLPMMKEANQKIEALVKGLKRAVFINTADSMYDADGTIKKDIFLSDNLHMNAKGYEIWKGIMEPYLR
ncbi:MAG: GDSL-type esterase/lipase family protein [Pedobacter sp.]|nr:GDSL-type esterase/lipase family protein [Pedobacter sp.]MDQ8054565.1 GDSL-type esterase/lipase family protein [Pedobacter sp.]